MNIIGMVMFQFKPQPNDVGFKDNIEKLIKLLATPKPRNANFKAI